MVFSYLKKNIIFKAQLQEYDEFIGLQTAPAFSVPIIWAGEACFDMSDQSAFVCIAAAK